jgi:hypothetical protein
MMPDTDLHAPELELVRAFRSAIAPATPGRLALGREALLEAARTPSRRRPAPPRLRTSVGWATIVGSAAAAAAIALTVSPGHRHAAPVARLPRTAHVGLTAQMFLRRAARHYAANAGAQPEPSAGQWLYVAADQLQNGRSSSNENWETFDGTRSAYVQSGRLVTHTGMTPPAGETALQAYNADITPMTAYALLASLPRTNSPSLLAAVDADIAQLPPQPAWFIELGDAPQTTGQKEFDFLAQLVWNALVPPSGAEAAVFDAMATIPGVTIVRGLTDAAGGAVVAISDNGGAGQLLFSTATDEVAGLSVSQPAAEKTPGAPAAGTARYGLAWAAVAQVAAPGDR